MLSYNEYVDLKRVRDYLAMQKIYQVTKNAGITAREVYKESRRQLKTRGSDGD